MKFAGLAAIVATLAVVFTLSAFAETFGSGGRPPREVLVGNQTEASESTRRRTDAGRRIEICQSGDTKEMLWNEAAISGLDESGRAQTVFGQQLINGCKIITNSFWTGTVEVMFVRYDQDFVNKETKIHNPEVEYNRWYGNSTQINYYKKFDIPPTPLEQPFRCEPEIELDNLRKRLNNSTIVSDLPGGRG
ncbi:MAG: hypothetical protein BJ554DRAFT_2340 [Olpidium bornovanus]|uniref:Uncharacterized protein n=1 Tax=Olpidium bornovanus TaxID=278681 RepID=A0A8H7ZQM7_9FUNG|nr:MAG: hypothetical protein BJ554DRAFT_2340 [Olpidium bornovanus]